MNKQTQEALKMAIEALNKLARLGNGDSYGNSDGNCIAIKTLKAIEEALEQPTVAELNNEYLRDTNVIGLEQPPPKVEPFDVWAGTKPQEIGDAEIRQMLNDIEYYQNRVEELEQALKGGVK
jgi:hypothetical protein